MSGDRLPNCRLSQGYQTGELNRSLDYSTRKDGCHAECKNYSSVDICNIRGNRIIFLLARLTSSPLFETGRPAFRNQGASGFSVTAGPNRVLDSRKFRDAFSFGRRLLSRYYYSTETTVKSCEHYFSSLSVLTYLYRPVSRDWKVDNLPAVSFAKRGCVRRCLSRFQLETKGLKSNSGRECTTDGWTRG